MNESKSEHRGTRWLLAAGLLVLSPICAEYIVGYDDSTGDPVALVRNLLIFAPLYGAPALLIRELSRRFGVDWPGIIALAAAFGIAEAGIIDQSLFSDSYRDIAYWAETSVPTQIDPLGFSAYNSLNFIVGHVVWSFCIPIALVESLRPASAGRPWLRWPGLVGVSVLYLGAAALVLVDHLRNEKDHASTLQLVGSITVFALLAGYAFTMGRRGRSPDRDTPVPKPLVIGVLSLIVALTFDALPPTWLGVEVTITLLAVSSLAIVHLSRSQQWGSRHIVALAIGTLLGRTIVGFFAVPLGNVSPIAKYTHNIVFFMGAALLGAWAMSCNRPTQTSAR